VVVFPAVAAPPGSSKFDPSQFKHVRDTPAGVTYLGDKPFRFTNAKGNRVEVNPGERLSRRQYENLRYQAGGWSNKAEYEKVIHGHLHLKDRGRNVHEADAYRVWASIYAEEHNVSVRQAMGANSPFARAFAAAYKDKFRDTGPDSPFAQLLVLTGLRDEQDTWDVGESP
jgi:hypothetical protein